VPLTLNLPGTSLFVLDRQSPSLDGVGFTVPVAITPPIYPLFDSFKLNLVAEGIANGGVAPASPPSVAGLAGYTGWDQSSNLPGGAAFSSGLFLYRADGSLTVGAAITALRLPEPGSSLLALVAGLMLVRRARARG